MIIFFKDIFLKLDNIFDWFQSTKFGTWYLKGTSFLKILSLFGVILIAQVSAYFNFLEWSSKIDEQLNHSDGFVYVFWFILSFIVPDGNLFLIFISIVLLGIAIFFEYRKINVKTIQETLLNPLKEKTKNILFQIKTNIPFDDQSIEIDRSSEINKIQEKLEQKQVIIISGDGGVGKTAIVKKLYSDENIFYVVKAIELKEKDIFYGHNLQEFIDSHKEFKDKIFVIDSAEKLLDIEDREFFKEFLSALIQNDWKIIFTTRNNYLDDLNYEFVETYNLNPYHITVNNLSIDELQKLSNKYSFVIPEDEKLVNLIINPFYLNQFLQEYDKSNKESYLSFKAKLWNKLIFKSQSNREKCFLDLAYKRANNSLFFVDIDCEENILKQLVDDGILGYESNGYFITHDIYEEWALEKIIEKEFTNREDEISFFKKIRSSLPIRRSFRDWVSDKLLLKDENINRFIENVIENEEIEQFWKDEVLVSVLLSDYSDTFFENFEKEFFDNDAQLLKRVSFLLRIACKEVDNNLLEPYGLKVDSIEVFSMFNKPKGNGWKSFISFVYKNIDTIKLENINKILPIIYDWNLKNKKAETTRFASLIVLKYYELINQKEYKYSYDDYIEKICNAIISGTSEIQKELEVIFDEIIENKWKDSRDNYYNLSMMILSTSEGLPRAFPILQNMPQYVLKLANLFWSQLAEEKKDNQWYSNGEVEDAYGLDTTLRYSPSSSYQTPIYYMLKVDFPNTIDFILEFVNQSVKKYAQSGWEDKFSGIYSKFDFEKENIKEIVLQIDDKITVKQYHSQALWEIYRGTSSPVSPDLLQSIHMALEKYLLEIAKDMEHEDLENLLASILFKSKSSSITAVIASVVLANSNNTINIALALFRTKEFIYSDLLRKIKDETEAESLYKIGLMSLNRYNDVYTKERLETCKDKHRKSHLEKLFLEYQYYQFVDEKKVSKNVIEKIMKDLWSILDNYYTQLPAENEQSESDKTWRMFLARMDMRKMNTEVAETEKGFELILNSKLPSELKEHSKKSQEESQNTFKYASLRLWAYNKIKNNQDYKKYQEFEKNPLLALEQLEEVMKVSYDERDFIFNDDTFVEVSVILLKDYNEKLSDEDKDICKNIMLDFSKAPLQTNYHYQSTDGTVLAIRYLPILLDDFIEEENHIKLILFLNLFKGHYSAINAIATYFNEQVINSFMMGYLLLKPKYDSLYRTMRKENYRIKENEVREKFLNKFEEDIENFLNNNLSINDIYFNIDVLSISVILKFIKFKQVNPSVIFQEISKVFILKIFQPKEKEEKPLEKMTKFQQLDELFLKTREEFEDIDLRVKQRLFESLPHLIYKLDKIEIEQYLKPLLENFRAREDISYLLLEFIRVHDVINEYDKFWHIWNLFENKIIEICKDGEYSYADKIIQTYLLAWGPYGAIWKEKAKEWHSLKEKDKRFFKRISQNIGHCPSTLYSISKLLIGIGSSYLNDGIGWISFMVKNNKNLFTDKLEPNTVFYIENLTRKYILENSEKIKKDKVKKQELLEVLNFLVEKGSAIGYMLRERVL